MEQIQKKYKMKFYLILFIFFPFWIFAQPIIEPSKKKVDILIEPKVDAPKIETPNIPPHLYKIFEPKDFNFLKEEEKNVDFTGQNSPKYKERAFELPKNVTGIPERSDSRVKIKKEDQYFGEHTAEGEYFNMYCRDHSAIDGDLVSIYLNDELVLSNIMLTGDFVGYNIPLKMGFNKVEIKALNEGESSPNTAEFMAVNQKGQVLFREQWGLATGFKARFIIIKN